MSHWIEQCRKLGQQRLDLLGADLSPEQRKESWPAPAQWPFSWGDCWKACITLRVADLPAELGFFMDCLGFTLVAWWEGHTMIQSPDGAFMLTLGQADPGHAIDPATTGLELMLGNIHEAHATLIARGLDLPPVQAEWGDSNPMRTCNTMTPNGISLKLWGMLPG